MAKRYDTQEDLQKDVLKDLSAGAQLKSEKQATTGLTLLGGSMLADIFHWHKPETRGWLRYVSFALSIGALIQIVRSWVTSFHAQDIEHERQKLGPQTVVLPPMGGEPGCGCQDRMHSHAVVAKSLIDQASRSDFTPGKV